MNIRRIAIAGAAGLALVAGGTAAGAAAFPNAPAVDRGCITGTNRIMEHVFTRPHPPACPPGSFATDWNQVGPQGPPGPSGVASMTQYSPGAAAPVTGSSWAFLGTPPSLTFTNSKTAAQVTATVDEASADGNEASGELGICYQASGGSVNNVSLVEPDFVAPEDSFFAQTVSGDVGNLPSGSYLVGLCAEAQSDMENGFATVTITLAQTASGVNYAGPRAAPAKPHGTQ
jgi:hypothetical protein